MIQRKVTVAGLAALALLALGAEPVHAKKYRYGSYRVGATQPHGFILFLDAGAANPRNTDNVVATLESDTVLLPIIPEWDTDLAGRLGLGYRWPSGSKVEAVVWGFSTKSEGLGGGASGDVTHFSIGPPICTVDTCAGANGSPGFFAVTTEITAGTADLAWGRAMELSEAVLMEWSLGLRYAYYEETAEGPYGDTSSSNLFEAAKSHESNMVGVRAALRLNYRFAENFSVSGGLGFSALDGEVEASSGLDPASGQGLTPSYSSILDDSRSGSIQELDLVFNWHLAADAFRLYGGWEQQEWRDIAADLMRNFPGSTITLRDRDSVIFSAYKLGVYFRF